MKKLAIVLFCSTLFSATVVYGVEPRDEHSTPTLSTASIVRKVSFVPSSARELCSSQNTHAEETDSIFIPVKSYRKQKRPYIATRNDDISGVIFHKAQRSFCVVDKNGGLTPVSQLHVGGFEWSVSQDKIENYVRNLAWRQGRGLDGDLVLQAYVPLLGGGGLFSKIRDDSEKSGKEMETARMARVITINYELPQQIMHYEISGFCLKRGNIIGKKSTVYAQAFQQGILAGIKTLKDDLSKAIAEIDDESMKRIMDERTVSQMVGDRQDQPTLPAALSVFISVLEKESQIIRVANVVKSFLTVPTAILNPGILSAMPFLSQHGAKLVKLADAAIAGLGTYEGVEGIMSTAKQVRDLGSLLETAKSTKEGMEIAKQISTVMADVEIAAIKNSTVAVGEFKTIEATAKNITSNTVNLKSALLGAGLAIGGYIGGRLLEFGVEYSVCAIAEKFGWDKEKAGMVGQGIFFGGAAAAYGVLIFGVGCTTPFIMIPLGAYVMGRALDFAVNSIICMVYKYSGCEASCEKGIKAVKAEFSRMYAEGLDAGCKEIFFAATKKSDIFRAFDTESYDSGLKEGQEFFESYIRDVQDSSEVTLAKIRELFDNSLKTKMIGFSEKELKKLFI